MTTSLEALADSARHGDAEALAELYERFSPLSNRLLTGYRSLSFHDDLPGELFIAFAVLVRKYDPARGIPFSHFMSHMLPMTIHTVVRRERRERSRQLLLVDVVQPGDDSSELTWRNANLNGRSRTSPQNEILDTVITRDVLLHLLGNLTPLQSAVFVSHAIEDEEFSRIAHRLGKSLGAVRFAYFAARQRMKRDWGDSFDDPHGRNTAVNQHLSNPSGSQFTGVLSFTK